MSSEQLSPHFTLAEFACRCGCGYEKRPEIKAHLRRLCERILEPLRAKLGGKRTTINSGARCPAYNAKVGGASKSEHLRGAADVVVEDVSPKDVQAAAATIPGIGGIGCYATFTHLDIGVRRSWRG